MNLYLLGMVGVIYCWVAISYGQQERYGMMLAFIAYALANAGFMVDIWLESGGRGL